jgi:hypothetical protein
MRTPVVSEIPPRLEPVTPDTFLPPLTRPATDRAPLVRTPQTFPTRTDQE